MGNMTSAHPPALRCTGQSVKAHSKYCLDAGTGTSLGKAPRDGGC